MSDERRLAEELEEDGASGAEGEVGRDGFGGVVLGFAGGMMMLFGLPLAVALPAGLIWGKNKDGGTILALLGVTVVGAIFVYAASLLLGAGIKALKGGKRA